MQVPQVTEEFAIAVLDLYPTLISLARAYSLLVRFLSCYYSSWGLVLKDYTCQKVENLQISDKGMNCLTSKRMGCSLKAVWSLICKGTRHVACVFSSSDKCMRKWTYLFGNN